jgi:hypothetical protein
MYKQCVFRAVTWQTDEIGFQKCDLGLPSLHLSPRQLQQWQSRTFQYHLILNNVFCLQCVYLWVDLSFCICTGRFLRSLTGSRLCASRLPAHRRLWVKYEFCRWMSMPDGRWCLELKEAINFLDNLMALCFMAISAVHVWECVYDLQQWAAVINSISHLFCYN